MASRRIAKSAVASAQEVRLTHGVGAPSRRCPEQAHQHLGGAGRWGTQARPGGAPKQAAEAMPSSRGDARAAERVRTGGAKSPDKFLSRSAGRECTAFASAPRGIVYLGVLVLGFSRA